MAVKNKLDRHLTPLGLTMVNLFIEYLSDLIDPFFNPQKRVFVFYLLSALVISIIFQLVVVRKSFRQSLNFVFSKKVWLSRSAFADYKLLLINQILMMGIVPRLVTTLAVATILFEKLHILLGGRIILFSGTPDWVIAFAFTLTFFLMDDASKYFVHRALHRWPILWAFHRVHHSAETLTPLTVYRTHPVEAIIFSIRSVIVQGIAVSMFIFFFGSRAELMTLLGANAILFFFNVAGSNLRHSNVNISYGPIIERFLISPAQHQIHHSRHSRHYDRNFGVVLAIWDWFGNSLSIANRNQNIQFGLAGSSRVDHSLLGLYFTPFKLFFHTFFQYIFRDFFKMRYNFLRFFRHTSIFKGLVLLSFFSVFSSGAQSAELNIYSHRQPFLIKPFLDAYTEEYGTKINVVYASKGLVQRLQAEGTRSPADVILTVDIARLYVYADKNLLAPTNSNILKTNIPIHLRDQEDRWFAFSKRARVIAVSKRASDAQKIMRYEDLVDPKWKGRICSRPGSHVYNRALVASIINANGVKAANAWAEGVVKNLARRPQGNDRAQVKAIYEGLCDIAIINNYYFGKLKYAKKAEQREWAKSVNLIFPNQNDRGTHVNISGGGIAKHSRNKEEAKRFLEFLTSKFAQDKYAEVNFEYPVNPRVNLSKELSSWGKFEEDKMPIYRVAELAADAQRVIDRAGW